MSIRVTSAVWDLSPQSGSVLLVLLALADHADDSGVCWPSIPSLARRGRTGERNVQATLLQLERAGEIVRHLNAGPATAHGSVNRFRVLAGSTGYAPKLAEPRERSKGVNASADRGERCVQNGVNAASPRNIIEPSVESSAAATCESVFGQAAAATNSSLEDSLLALQKFDALPWRRGYDAFRAEFPEYAAVFDAEVLERAKGDNPIRSEERFFRDRIREILADPERKPLGVLVSVSVSVAPSVVLRSGLR